MRTLNQNQPVVEPSSKRVILFKTISVLLPVLLLGLVEMGLRFFKYGYDPSLFIEDAGNQDYWVFNPQASRRYFSNPQIATTGNTEPFKKKKAPNTLRLFVLGESTTIGYPYFHNGSFHRWLQYRLTHTFPDKNFEIINLSLTAVNTYTVSGFAREVVDYEPDAVLLYTGHNEYYGALGVGSTEQIGGNPLLIHTVLQLRKLRLVQLLTNGYETLQNSIQTTKTGSAGTRMKLMVADQQIPYQSERYERGIRQFRTNLNQTLERFSSRNIPVFISNLVSNEKDLKPFASLPVDSATFPDFKREYELGVEAFNKKDWKAAERYFKAANRVGNHHARCQYYLGQAAFQQGDFKQAKGYFTRAKDLDGLRFRAPEALNTVIAQLCKKYKNAHFVDAKAVFEAHSTHRIIGDELMLEHVHPNLTGYALLSDAFYEGLKQQKLISVSSEPELNFQSLVQQMPITKVDSLAGVYKVASLKQSWPFSRMMTARSFTIQSIEEQLAHDLAAGRLPWFDAMSKLYAYYVGNRQFRKARKTVEALTLEYPNDAQYYEKAAMLSGELKDDDKAIFYFRKAFVLVPSFDKARYLFVLYLKLDQPVAALPYLEYAIQHNATQFDLNPVKAYAQQIIQWQNLYGRDSSNVPVLNQIAVAYYKMDNKDAARKYVRKVLKADAHNKDALALLPHLK